MGGEFRGLGRGKGTRRGAKQWNNREHTGEELRLLAINTCNKKQTLTMFAGPAGVAPGVGTMLAPLDSSWVTLAKSCTNRMLSALNDPPHCPTNQHRLAQCDATYAQHAKSKN